jgi:GntR family transcriptional repressor for pyruvate dehydrogenase complex
LLLSARTKDSLLATIPRPDTLGTHATDRLERLIRERHFNPGDRLPSERELAEQFGVSRTVIREAVRVLVAKSLLEVRPGSGTVVRAPSKQSVIQSVAAFVQIGQADLDYRKVHEVRRVLEVEIAGLAAERRSPEDLKALEAQVKQMLELRDDQPAFGRNDLGFHVLLARATHNELFALLLDSVADILFKVRELGNIVPGAPDHAIRHHKNILRQVKAGDPLKARQAMIEHLIDSEAIFNRAVDALEEAVRT